MLNNKTVLLIFLILIIRNVYSQTSSMASDINIIDVKLKACLDSSENQTTVGMIGCTAMAENLWDAEMNKYYKLLMGILSPDEKEKLKASQIKWLSFRDSETITSNTIYTNLQGTMWRIVAVDTQMELVKQRALGLKSYYSNLSIK